MQKTNTSVRIVANGIDVGEWTRSNYWGSIKTKAEDIVYEFTEYGIDIDDVVERIDESADNSAWVFTYFAQRLVPFYCSPDAYDEARSMVEEFYYIESGGVDWDKSNQTFAYIAVRYDINSLVEEALKK